MPKQQAARSGGPKIHAIDAEGKATRAELMELLVSDHLDA